MGGRPQLWSVSGLASMGAHAAFVTGCLLWSLHHPAPPARDRPTEFEVRTVAPPASPRPASVTPLAPARGRARAARGVRLGRAAPIPISHDEAALSAPRSGVPEGDEDSSFFDPSPSTVRGEVGAGSMAAAPTTENGIAPLEAAYLCTYQSLRGLPRSLYVRGKVYRLLVQMCIGSDGRVKSATLQEGAAPALDAQVLVDMRQWRYKPRIVHGTPSAFCYKVKVSYEID
jgi:outer membrane biosynthesis protein TonB